MNEKCVDSQVRVMLLGTYHMESPGRDVIKPEVDDVLSPKRQGEISSLIKSLARWEPEIIAVEFPYEKQDELNALYKKYIQNSAAFEDSHLSSRNEIVQIGFRLAHHLNHEKLLAVDWFPEFPEWITKEDFEDVMYFTPEMRSWNREQIELEEKSKLEKLTIAQYLYWLNSKPQININDTIMIDISLEHKNKKVAFSIASNWFERNLGIIRNLKEILPGGVKRVLLLYGAGHIPMLNYIMEMSSIFCPVSPLPYLKEEIMKVPNLDYIAALTAQKISTVIGEVLEKNAKDQPKRIVKKEDLENLTTKSLGILQSQGIYASMLFLLSRSGKGSSPGQMSAEERCATEIVSWLDTLLKPENFIKSPPDPKNFKSKIAYTEVNSKKDEILKEVAEVTGNLDSLLLVRNLWGKVLIYLRFHAKAYSPSRSTAEE